MRLIDADSLIEEINKVYDAEEKEDLMWSKGLHYAKAIIRNIPTIPHDMKWNPDCEDCLPEGIEDCIECHKRIELRTKTEKT